MKKNYLRKAWLPLLLGTALLAGCGGSDSPESGAASASAQSAQSASSSQMEVAEAGASSGQAGSPAAQTAETPEPTAAPTPSPTPEENLPDGTVHTPLTEAGSVYISENKAYSPYYFASESGEAYAAMLNAVSDELAAVGIRTFSILPPTSFAVNLGQEVQAEMNCSDETAAIEYTYSMIGANVIPVRVMDAMIRHNAEYLFFGTDHHWTQRGAYIAYREWCAAAGLTPHELTDYPSTSFPGFLGLFYIYSDYSETLAANPDTVEAWIPIATNELTVSTAEGEEYAYNVVADVSAGEAGSKYSAFLGGDAALCTIHNPSLSDGSACILIKDSFGNAFAPFLVDHYETVYVIDYRYMTGNLIPFAQAQGVKDVIILTNVDEILQSTSETIQSLFAAS